MIFLYQSLATHIMTPIEFGFFSKWLTDIALLGAFFTLGLDVSVVYFTRKGELFEKNIVRNIAIYFLMVIIFSAFIFLFFKEQYPYFILLLTISFLSIAGLFSSYFQYIENFKIYSLITLLKSTLILLPMLYFSVIQDDKTYYEIILVYCYSIFTSMIITFFFYKKRSTFSKPNVYFSKDYILYGLRSVLNKSLGLILYSSSIYSVFYFSGPEKSAYFFVAIAISKLVWVLPDAAGNILYPKFVKSKSNELDFETESQMFFYAQIVFVVNIICFLSFLMLGQFLLNVVYDTSYYLSYAPVLILLVGNQGMVYYKLLSRYFISQNHWLPMRVSLLSAIIFNILGNYFLQGEYGIIGAAVATCISFWLCGILMTLYYKRAFTQFLNISSCCKSFSFK